MIIVIACCSHEKKRSRVEYQKSQILSDINNIMYYDYAQL